MTAEDRIRHEQILAFLVRELEKRLRRDALQLAIEVIESADNKSDAIKRLKAAWKVDHQ